MSGRRNGPTMTSRDVIRALDECRREALEVSALEPANTPDGYRELARDLGKIINLTMFATSSSPASARRTA